MSEFKDRSNLGRIVADYDGNYSDRITWDKERLNTAIEVADGRTNVSILRGNAASTRNYVTLGETLAWRSFLNLGLIGQSKDPDWNIMVNFRTASAVLSIHDQIICDRLSLGGERPIQIRSYAQAVSQAATHGLMEIVRAEKLHQFKVSSEAAAPLALALSGTLLYGAGLSAIFTSPYKIEVFVVGVPLVLLSVPMIGAGTTVELCARLFEGTSWEELVVTRESGNRRYFSSRGDLSPLTHLARMATAKCYLGWHRNMLVRPKE